ncbi:MAG: hypothetical protein ACK5ME_12855 [Parahaliea sp.]
MSDISYSFSMTNNAAPAQKDGVSIGEPVELYAVDDYRPVGVAGGVLLVGATTGAQLLAQTEVDISLQHCRVFRSMEGHAHYLASVLPQLGGNVDDALRVLEMVREAGLFVSASEFCERINTRATRSDEADLPKAFIITCDRPVAVNRLLESMKRNARLSSIRQLYLVDDSRDEANAAANREMVERFNLESPTRMNYVGSEAQRELQTALEARLPEHVQAIRFLIDRSSWGVLETYGRARILCQLLSVGDRAIIMDDDVLCMAARSGEGRSDLGFTTEREAIFYGSSQDWQAFWQPTDFDPISGHARCLGLSLSEVMASLGKDKLEPHQLTGVEGRRFYEVDGSAPVLITQSGTVGDPGTSGNGWLPYLPAASVRYMLAESSISQALSTRDCWLGQLRPAVSKRAVMSQVTGLDNRVELPPYFPALRGEDHFFGTLVDFLFPDSLVLEYDWAVPHLPLEPRIGNPEGDNVAPKGGLQMVSAWLADARPMGNGIDFNTRLQLAAARIGELANMTEQALLASYRVSLTRAQAYVLQTVNDRLAETGALDEQWRVYLEKSAQACVNALAQPARLSDLDHIPADCDNAAVAKKIRWAAKGYSNALLAWSSIRQAAADYQRQK